MNEIRVTDKISYIQASADPLSADIGIIRDNDTVWLFDVGDDPLNIPEISDDCNVVISHFHKDHSGNLSNTKYKNLYVSAYTQKHINTGTVVDKDLYVGNVHVFKLPSSHSKGSLAMEIDGEYAFVGDGLYCTKKNDCYVYNAQHLKEEIDILKSIKADTLLVSHFPGLLRKKQDVIEELEKIYKSWTKESPYIELKNE